MKNPVRLLLAAPLLLLLAACTTPPREHVGSMSVASATYALRPPLEGSLFPADQAILSDEAIERILAGKLELRDGSKVAILKFPDSQAWASQAYGQFYWASAAYLRLQQEHVDTFSAALLRSELIQEVTPLPTLMTPKDLSIPSLREPTVRMQADMLLVYRITGDTFTEYRLFARDRVKVYSTCEVILLDVRTGLVPFTRVITREKEEEKQPSDSNLAETTRRAQMGAATLAVAAAAEDLVRFIDEVPRRGEGE